MIDHHQSAGSPVTAAVALGAAAAGMLAHWIDGAAHLFAAPSPEDITAYTRAIVGAIAMTVNLIVGSYHALKIAWLSGRAAVVKLQRLHRRRKPPKHRNTPGAGPAPHTDPTPGAQPNG